MIRAGARVHTIDGVDGTVVAIRPNYSGFDQVIVALDGHTYGPAYPGHTYPIGAVWLVEGGGAPDSAPVSGSEPVAPSWYPTGVPRDVVVDVVPEGTPARQYGDGWLDDYSAPGEVSRARRLNDAIRRARRVRRARRSSDDQD